MLNKFKKLFTEQKEVEMTKEDTQADMSVVDINEQLAAANEALASNATAMEKLNEQVAELTAKLEAAQTALAAVEAEKAEMLAAAKQAKLDVRKEKIVAAVGTEKAEALMAATEGLEDTAFEAVVSALAGSVTAEASTDMFKEVGVDAEAKADVADEKPTHFNNFIKK